MKNQHAAPDKIFLVGYRACGKTAVGGVLAARLGWDFLDMDRELVRRAGISIKEMVAAQGWDYFRRRERELLQELAHPIQVGQGRSTGLVVATGGGAVLQEDLWREIKKSFPVIWLTADPDTIATRLRADPMSKSQRPALTNQGLVAEIDQVLRQRQDLYQQAARLIIDTTATDPVGIAARIMDWLPGFRPGDEPG